MTLRRLTLESFETADSASDRFEIDRIAFEDARLEAFEKGYTAGWDDAVAAQGEDIARFRSELGQNLQRMSFSYHDARQHVLEALRPLIIGMAAKVLPRAAQLALPHMIADELAPHAEALSAAPISIVANPKALPQIRAALSEQPSLPMIFAADPALGEGQVHLKYAETETKIDLDGVIDAIDAAITGYFNTDAQEPANG